MVSAILMNIEDEIISVLLTGFGFSLAFLWDFIRERRKEKRAKIRAIKSLIYETEENLRNSIYLEKIHPRDDVWRQIVWSGRIDLLNESLYNALDDLYLSISDIETEYTHNPMVIPTNITKLQNKLKNVIKKLEKGWNTHNEREKTFIK